MELAQQRSLSAHTSASLHHHIVQNFQISFLNEELNQERLIHKSGGMEYEVEVDWQGHWSGFDTEMNAFDATGGEGQQPAGYPRAADPGRGRTTPDYPVPTLNSGGFSPRSIVSGYGMTQEFQSGMTPYILLSPNQDYAGDSGFTPYMQAGEHYEAPAIRSELGYNDQSSSGPGHQLGPWRYGSALEHAYHAVPSIHIDSLNGASEMAGSYSAEKWPIGYSTTATPCVIRAGAEKNEGQGLYLSPRGYDQDPSSRRSSTSSIASAPGWLPERTFDHTRTSVEHGGWRPRSASSNVSDLPGVQRFQRDIPVRPSATDERRESSTLNDERLYCTESRCRATFQGSYAKGSLARHRRLKHGSYQQQEGREYMCEQAGCSKSYKRQDARLKHYRKVHRHLAPGPALSRTKYRSV